MRHNGKRQHGLAMLVRDAVSLNPTLDGRVISMAQLAGHRTNAATEAYQVCIGHDAYVRRQRTQVNVESVRTLHDYAIMSEKRSIGGQLLDLKNRAALSLDAIADAAGYAGRSSIQRFFHEDFEDEFLSPKIAVKLAKAFEGTVVGAEPIMALAGMPAANATPAKYEGAPDVRMERDLPIHGTALGAPRDLEGHAVEQTMLNSGEIVGYIPRPAVLRNVKDAYAVYVQGSSMSPRHDPGETLIVTDGRKRPPRIGDDVVVYMRDVEEDDGQRARAVLVKRLIRRSASFVELEQFNPPLVFRVEASQVVRIDRVVPWSEILS